MIVSPSPDRPRSENACLRFRQIHLHASQAKFSFSTGSRCSRCAASARQRLSVPLLDCVCGHTSVTREVDEGGNARCGRRHADDHASSLIVDCRFMRNDHEKSVRVAAIALARATKVAIVVHRTETEHVSRPSGDSAPNLVRSPPTAHSAVAAPQFVLQQKNRRSRTCANAAHTHDHLGLKRNRKVAAEK